MVRRLLLACSLAFLTSCATTPRHVIPGPVEVQILGINDFHGNLEPPKIAIDATLPDGLAVKIPAGGVAYLAGAAKALRAARRIA